MRLTLLVMSIAFLSSCGTRVEPEIPKYDAPVVVEGEPRLPANAEVVDITVADLDNDGLPDVVVANRDNSPDGNNWVCLNRTEANFSLDCEALVSGSSTTISVADINADGSLDLVIPYRDGGQSHVFWGDGAGSFVKGPAFGPGDAWFRAAIAVDLNGDDRLDLVAIDDEKRTTTAFHQIGASQFDEGVRMDDGNMMPYALDSADLDGVLDIVAARSGASDVLFMGLN